MRSFASDNNSGVHPEIMQAIQDVNQNHAVGYGADPWTEAACTKIKEVIGEEVLPQFVFNGTGANVVALQLMTRPFHTVFCAETGHIYVDECGAPAQATGCHFRPIATENGKLTPELIRPHIHGVGDQHHSQPRAIYISQCTEMGTIYTLDDLKLLRSFADKHNLYILMDGARIANACCALGCSLRAMTVETGIDIVVLGGTKNGLMVGECLLIINDKFKKNAHFVRKQQAQLASKMRYLSCQFTAYLDNVWLKNARHANEMATRLYKGLSKFEQVTFTQEMESNQLFLKMPYPVIDALLEDYFFYFWNEAAHEIRFVASWDTTKEDVDALISRVGELLEEFKEEIEPAS